MSSSHFISKWFLWSFLLMGCNEAMFPPHYTTHPSISQVPLRIVPLALDIRFSHEEHQQLHKAIDEWNMALNNEMRLDVYTDAFDMADEDIKFIYDHHGAMLLSVPKSASPVKFLNSDVRAAAYGIGLDCNTIYFIQEKVDAARIHNIALHELGHLLGAEHTHYGLMLFRDDPVQHQCIDYSAIEQVATYNHLNIQALNWCEQ